MLECMNTLIQTLLRSLVSVRCERGYLQLESLALRHQGGGFKAISKTDLLRSCGSRLMASVVNLVAHVAASVARLRLGIPVWMALRDLVQVRPEFCVANGGALSPTLSLTPQEVDQVPSTDMSEQAAA